jgi:hypothetical protein
MRFLSSALAFLVVGACGGDDGTGPGSTNLTGTWSASVSNMTSTGVSCSSTSPTQLTLTQTGATFSGSYDGGAVSCSTPGGTLSSPVGSGLVANGQVNGNSVSFDLDTPELHHTGTVSGTSMSGTAQWQVDYEGLGTVTLNGNWEATKQ